MFRLSTEPSAVTIRELCSLKSYIVIPQRLTHNFFHVVHSQNFYSHSMEGCHLYGVWRIHSEPWREHTGSTAACDALTVGALEPVTIWEKNVWPSKVRSQTLCHLSRTDSVISEHKFSPPIEGSVCAGNSQPSVCWHCNGAFSLLFAGCVSEEKSKRMYFSFTDKWALCPLPPARVSGQTQSQVCSAKFSFRKYHQSYPMLLSPGYQKFTFLLAFL